MGVLAIKASLGQTKERMMKEMLFATVAVLMFATSANAVQLSEIPEVLQEGEWCNIQWNTCIKFGPHTMMRQRGVAHTIAPIVDLQLSNRFDRRTPSWHLRYPVQMPKQTRHC
jgi:hypothetical protein